MAPVGTSDAIVRQISADLRKVLLRPEIKDKLAVRGGFVRPMSPEEALAFVAGEQKQWQPVLEQIAREVK